MTTVDQEGFYVGEEVNVSIKTSIFNAFVQFTGIKSLRGWNRLFLRWLNGVVQSCLEY